MEPNAGFTLHQLWAASEPAITQKTTRSKWSERQWHPSSRISHCRPANLNAARQCFPQGIRHPGATDGPTKEPSRSGKETSVKTKLRQSWIECKKAKRLSLKKDGGEMLIAIVLDKPLGRSPSVSTGSRCIHASNHTDHARQTQSSSHCANNPSRCKRWTATFGVRNWLHRRPKQPYRNDTLPRTAANSIPISTSRQRRIPTVGSYLAYLRLCCICQPA